MKRILGVLAAGLLAVASFNAAQAADTSATAGASMKAAAPVDTTAAVKTDVTATTGDVKAATQQVTLKDGTTLTIDDKQMAWTTDASGKNVAATDGDKVTADGKTLTVKDGKVVAGLEATGAAGEAPAAGSTAPEAK
jgi:hypothetical protein